VIAVWLFVASQCPAASSAPALTLVVTPSTVVNGSVAAVRGTAASCAVVVIRAHPGALGVTGIGPIEAPVRVGRYSTSVRLPRFVPDPSRPRLNATQFFEAICAGMTGPEAMTTLSVTGTELATSSNPLPSAIVGLAAVIIGCAFAGATVRRQRRAWPPIRTRRVTSRCV